MDLPTSGSGGGEIGCLGAVIALTIVAMLFLVFLVLVGWMLRDAGVF